jgi:hypothetical protein
LLENVIDEIGFAKIMNKSIEDIIIHFFDKEQNFGILCRIEEVEFSPALPPEINAEFRALTLFFLAGYTFETARIENGMLIFEAGFGEENIGSVVTLSLLSIMQIIVDETPIFINLSVYKDAIEKEDESDTQGIQNSMASFLSNPENSKFLK